MRNRYYVVCLVAACFPALAQSKLEAGAGKADITPPVGTPLAGYGARAGGPSTGVRDPLEARALILAAGAEKLALVAVDHLGYDHAMVERVRDLSAEKASLPRERIWVMSSHTHAGGGAYLALFPELAGKFDPKIRAFYEERAAEAVVNAARAMRPARLAVGAGAVPGLSRFRSAWPPGGGPVDPEVGVLRVDDESGNPLAVLMNFAAHPTVLSARNFQFSADFPGYARRALERLLGGNVMALYANGAQGTISPRAFRGSDEWARAENVGVILAAEAFKIAHMIEPKDAVDLQVRCSPLTLKPQMPAGIPPGRTLGDTYLSEVCGFTLDRRFAFVTIPGELSSLLNAAVKERGRLLGYERTFLLGLTNDAVGYILSEDEYRHGTYESRISLFGPHFGSTITTEASLMLEKLRPPATRESAAGR